MIFLIGTAIAFLLALLLIHIVKLYNYIDSLEEQESQHHYQNRRNENNVTYLEKNKQKLEQEINRLHAVIEGCRKALEWEHGEPNE